MLLLVCCCFCFGVKFLLWFLKGLIHGSSGDNQVSEPDDADVLVLDRESEAVADGTKTCKSGRGKVKGGLTHPKLSIKQVWIERKLFSAFFLLPGRTIRVTEKHSDRSFSVDFKINELSWLIVALREASFAKSGSFAKQFSIGNRFLEVSTEVNRSGEFLKFQCSFGGRNRRSLYIPAGKNRVGWGLLAKALAALSNGGKVWVIKSSHTSSSPVRIGSLQHREPSVSTIVSSKVAVRGKAQISHSLEDSGWTEGFLPDMLKSGLNLSLGASSTSGEADRSFVWKKFQSEAGLGTLVVELSQRDEVLGLKNNDIQIVRGRDECLAGGVGVDDASSGELVGRCVAEAEEFDHGEEEDDKMALQSDAEFFANLGNLIPKAQSILSSADALSVLDNDPLAGGPAPAGSDQSIFADSRDEISLSEQVGCVCVRAEETHLACGLFHQVKADASVSLTLGEIMGFGDDLMGLVNERAGTDQIFKISGGLAAGSDAKSYQFKSNGMGSFLGNVHVLPDDTRFMARLEDITIFDNVETLSFDSPVSDSSARAAEETSVEEGVSFPEDFCVICGSLEPCDGFGGSDRQ